MTGSSVDGASFNEMLNMIMVENSEKVRATVTMWRNMDGLLVDLHDLLVGKMRPLKEGAWKSPAADAFYTEADRTKDSFARFPASAIADAVEPIATAIDTAKESMASLKEELDDALAAASTYEIAPADDVVSAFGAANGGGGTSYYDVTVAGETTTITVGLYGKTSEQLAWGIVAGVQQGIRDDYAEKARHTMRQLIDAYTTAGSGLTVEALGNENIRFNGPVNANLDGIPVAFNQEGYGNGGGQIPPQTGLPPGSLVPNEDALDGTQNTGLPPGALQPIDPTLGGRQPLIGIPVEAVNQQFGQGGTAGNDISGLSERHRPTGTGQTLPADALRTLNGAQQTAGLTGLPVGALQLNSAAAAALNGRNQGGLDPGALTSRGIAGRTGLPPGSVSGVPGATTGIPNPNGAPTAPPHPGSFSSPRTNPTSLDGRRAGSAAPPSLPPHGGSPALTGRRTDPATGPQTSPRRRSRRPTTGPVVAGRTGADAVTSPTMPALPGTPTVPPGTTRTPPPLLRRRPGKPDSTRPVGTRPASADTVDVGEPRPVEINLVGRHQVNPSDTTSENVTVKVDSPLADAALAGRTSVPASTPALRRRRPATSGSEEPDDFWTPDTKPAVLDTPAAPTPVDIPALGRTPAVGSGGNASVPPPSTGQ